MTPEIVAAIRKMQAANTRIAAARFNQNEIGLMLKAADEEYEMALKNSRTAENELLGLVRGGEE